MPSLLCLQSRPNCNAILLTTEITTPAYYKGKDKHRQVTNMIFRTGASAVLFSNKRHMVRRAKYVLDTNYRVHLASRDPAYKCIWYGPDAEGNNGEWSFPARLHEMCIVETDVQSRVCWSCRVRCFCADVQHARVDNTRAQESVLQTSMRRQVQ
jgi:hypothetical protein